MSATKRADRVRDTATNAQPGVDPDPHTPPPPPTPPTPTPRRAPQSSPLTAKPWDVHARRCHLIGIGGCGMSGLARMLASRGALVSGSDIKPSPITDALTQAGVRIIFEQTRDSLPTDADLVIASAAIRPDHEERVAAKARGIEVLSYAEALGRCMLGRLGVAVAGTHGKSTTVGLLGHILIECQLDPTVIVGATCNAFKDAQGTPSGFRLGSSSRPDISQAQPGTPGAVLAEACEFNRSFHHLMPTIAAVMNVEADHLDIYGSIDGVVEAFAGFAANLPAEHDGGALLIAHEGAHRREVTAGAQCRVETIGYAPAADWRVRVDTQGHATVTGMHKGDPVRIGPFKLRQPGEHMLMNAAFAAVLAAWLGGEPDTIAAAIASFAGVDRRMQRLNDVPMHTPQDADNPARCVALFDDYGHHPTEIDTTLRALRSALFDQNTPDGAARAAAGGRLICVFQPHQHSRTRFLLEEFAQSFTHADVVVVPEIYFVRDSEIEKAKVRSADLVDRLVDRGVKAMHVHPMPAIVDQLRVLVRGGDAVVVMGAGPVTWIAHAFADACAQGVRPHGGDA